MGVLCTLRRPSRPGPPHLNQFRRQVVEIFSPPTE